MRALLAALLAAVLCLLYACASQPAAPSSITEKEMSSMTCDQLTQEQRDFLEQAGLPCPADGKLTQRQVSLLETIRTMLDYLEQKYPGQSFTPVGFSSVSPVRSEDRLYVIPQGGDQKWDLFAVSKATDGTCHDEFAVVWARGEFSDLAIEPLRQEYGADAVKAFYNLYQGENLAFDGTQNALELLRSDLSAGGTIVICAEPADAQSRLEGYAQAMAQQGLTLQISVLYTDTEGFARANDDSYMTFYKDPSMSARFECRVQADGQWNVEQLV